MAEVALERVSKVYPGGVRAVDDVSLRVADRQFVVLVGPSGCGKSTTLRLIAGLESATDGALRIGDRVVNDVHPKDRDIAMVFQNYALYPHLTVYKNMAFGLQMRHEPRAQIERKVTEAAALLDIGDLLDRKPKALSGGQRQRVALGRAIVRNPKAFLFDEPLSNLDARLRVEMRAELKKLHRRLRTTTIYVTHDQEEAMTLGDRVVVMKDGRVQQDGRPLDVYEHPLNRFVAGFVGMPPMNFMDGTLVRDEGGHKGGPENRRADGAVRFIPASVSGRKAAGSTGVRVTGALADGLSARMNQTMTLGFRPEDVCDRPTGRFSGEDNRMDVTVSVVEPLGDRMDVYGQMPGGSQVVCRLDARDDNRKGGVQEGQALRLHLDMRRVHFFEPGETGVNIRYGGTVSSNDTVRHSGTAAGHGAVVRAS